MTEAEVKDNYMRTVCREYLDRAGERMVGPTEFSLVRFWWQNGYPLRVVCRVIRESPTCGGSLLYYQDAVDEAVRRHRSGM